MKIGIVGLGLIGGSMAKALKVAGHEVFGRDNDESVLQKAVLIGAIDDVLTDEIISDIDYLIVSVYPQGTIDLLNELVPKLKLALDNM